MIRRAEKKDASSIAEILVKTWKTAFLNIVDENYSSNLSGENYRNYFLERLENKKEFFFVNENDGMINGFIYGSVSNSKCDCEIIGLYVLPVFQNKGIGKKLCNALIEEFKKEEKSSVIIWTLDGAKNNSFYISLGAEKSEYKEYIIGGKKYSGVGFTLNI